MRRIRHKVSPAFTWTYRPALTVSDALRSLRGFPVADVQEQHQLSVSLSQTFEGKLPAPARPDTTAGDTVRAARGAPSERKITLLAVRTSALVYDFVRAREPGQSGLISDRLANTLTSDLLRGLQVQVEHDLFDEKPDGTRDFDPFLASLNLSFSVGGGAAAPSPLPGGGLRRGTGIVPELAPRDLLPGEEAPGPPEVAAGPWNVSLAYALLRTRTGATSGFGADRQTLNLALSFQPTRNWRAHWTTTYDFEEGRFLQQFVSLQRSLHDWVAQFRFTRTVAGNFSFDFTISLIPAPDIKFDYRQQSLPAALRQ